MAALPNRLVHEKLDGLRAELADLAFLLETQGRLDAADAVMTVSARVAEIRDEVAAGSRALALRPESLAPLACSGNRGEA